VNANRRTRAIGIIRVSRRNRSEGSGHSPEVQRRLIIKFARDQGWELRPEDILNENDIRDGNVSGGADLSERPGFGPAVARIERGGADVVLMADFSRFFRDIDVQRAVIAQVEAAGGELWTVSDGRISHETAESELTANLQGSVTHFQRRYARDKSVLAVEIAIEQGKVPWCQTAPGYLRDDDSKLRPDPAKVPIIRKAFEMRARGATVADVRACLAEHGVVKSYHGTGHLLRDRIYLGEVHFKNRVNFFAHEPIIDRDLFERVQRVAVPRGRRPKSERLLARLGVLRCASCDGRMVVGSQRQNGKPYHFYRCGHVREDCDQRATIAAETVEQLVIDAVRNAVADAEGRASAEAGVREAERDVERAQENYEAAMGALADFTDAAAVARLRELREAWLAAQARVDQLGGNRAAVTITAGKDWDRISYEGRRALIRATVESVVVSPGRGIDRVTIQFVGEELWAA
jgi:site-specific DNA recombinase